MDKCILATTNGFSLYDHAINLIIVTNNIMVYFAY